jgi:hypothetical protein
MPKAHLKLVKSYGALALSGSFLEVGGGGRNPEIWRRRGPHQSRCELVRAGARSLRLAQRIIIGFVQPLYFAAVEALIPDLKRRAEGFGYAQVLNDITERLSRCRETAILSAATLRGLGEEQFSRGVVIERHARSQSRYSYLNSFNVIARTAAASRTPRCVSSMIFRATRRVAGSSTTFRLEVSHTLFRTSYMLSTVSGSNAWPDRNGRIGMTHPHSSVGVGGWGSNTSVASRIHWISFGDLRQSTAEHIGCAGVSFMRAFRPPCQRTGAPVRDSQWPERRNLPRRGDPSAGSCVCSDAWRRPICRRAGFLCGWRPSGIFLAPCNGR